MLNAYSLPEHFLFSFSHFSVRWKTFGKIHLRDTRKCYLQIWPLYLQDNFQQVFLITLNGGSNNKSSTKPRQFTLFWLNEFSFHFFYVIEGNVRKMPFWIEMQRILSIWYFRIFNLTMKWLSFGCWEIYHKELPANHF